MLLITSITTYDIQTPHHPRWNGEITIPLDSEDEWKFCYVCYDDFHVSSDPKYPANQDTIIKALQNSKNLTIDDVHWVLHQYYL